MEHFNEILNRDDPTNPVEQDEIVESEEIEENRSRKIVMTGGQGCVEEDKSRESGLSR